VRGVWHGRWVRLDFAALIYLRRNGHAMRLG
jgi:hypothetical protein